MVQLTACDSSVKLLTDLEATTLKHLPSCKVFLASLLLSLHSYFVFTHMSSSATDISSSTVAWMAVPSGLINICVEQAGLLCFKCFLVLVLFTVLLISGTACDSFDWWCYRCCTTAVMAAGVSNVRTETLFKASAVTQENNIHSSSIPFKYTHMDHCDQMTAFTMLISAVFQFTLEEIFFRIHVE